MSKRQLHLLNVLLIAGTTLFCNLQTYGQQVGLQAGTNAGIHTATTTTAPIKVLSPLSGHQPKPLGCDTNSSVLNVTLCARSYTHNGKTYTTSGVEREVYTNQDGCDSTVYIYLKLADPRPTLVIDRGCVIATTVAYLSYQWIHNSTPIPGANGPSYTGTEPGGYGVIVEHFPSCFDTSSIYTCTPESFEDSTGNGVAIVEQNVNNQIKLFPNPSSGAVNLQTPIPLNLRITSLDGRVNTLCSNTKDVQINNLAKGIYFLEIRDTQYNLIKVERIVRN